MKFTVIGHPEPAGSKQAFVNKRTGRAQVVDANKKARPWKQQVAGLVAAELDGAHFACPVGICVTFFLNRPKGHYGSGRNSGVVKASAPAYPATRPDATKLLRGVEDALTDAGLWKDDGQVVEQTVFKRFGHPERCEIEVWPLAATQAVFDENYATREAA